MSLITAEGPAGQGGTGQGYQAIPLPRSPVGDAALLATMIRRSCGKQTRRAVLYVHCLRDSFVPPELAVWYLQRGFHFYVVDLRAARPHGREATLPEYFGCLDLAARQIRDTDGNDTVVVSAHRAGAVIAALWCHTRRAAKEKADALILADPDFGPDQRWLGRLLTAWSPATAAPSGSADSGVAELLPRAQRRVRRGLDIACPVLVISPATATAQPPAPAAPAWPTPARPAQTKTRPSSSGSAWPGSAESGSPWSGSAGTGSAWGRAVRATARGGPPARLGAHVTWLRLDGAGRPSPASDRETRKRLHEELRRWLGAYLSAEIRDQLL